MRRRREWKKIKEGEAETNEKGGNRMKENVKVNEKKEIEAKLDEEPKERMKIIKEKQVKEEDSGNEIHKRICKQEQQLILNTE